MEETEPDVIERHAYIWKKIEGSLAMEMEQVTIKQYSFEN